MFISSPITPEDALPMRLRFVFNRIFLLALCAALAASVLLAQAPLQANPLLTLCYGVWQHGATADLLEQNQPNWVIEDLASHLGGSR